MTYLRIRRSQAHLTQLQLSAMTGINRTTIGKYEHDKHINSAPVSNIYKLAKVLKCRIIDIIEPEEDDEDLNW